MLRCLNVLFLSLLVACVPQHQGLIDVKVISTLARASSGTITLVDGASTTISHGALTTVPIVEVASIQTTLSGTLVANWSSSANADTGQTCTLTGNAGVSGGAMNFDGSGDFADFPDSDAYDLGTADFTIEFEVKFNSLSGNQHIINHSTDGAGEGATPYAWAFYLSSGAVRVGVEAWSIVGGNAIGTPSTGTWYHVALSRSGSVFRWYWDGTLISSTTNSGGITGRAGTIKFGRAVSGIENFNGSIRRFRMTVGTARYTGSSYTTPAADFAGEQTKTHLRIGTDYSATTNSTGTTITNISGSSKDISASIYY